MRSVLISMQTGWQNLIKPIVERSVVQLQNKLRGTKSTCGREKFMNEMMKYFEGGIT
jgi:hypothetical protein